jgi:hypothetical protein
MQSFLRGSINLTLTHWQGSCQYLPRWHAMNLVAGYVSGADLHRRIDSRSTTSRQSVFSGYYKTDTTRMRNAIASYLCCREMKSTHFLNARNIG